MATKAKMEGNKRHLDKLDRVIFYVDKGGKDKIKQCAAMAKQSANAYIVTAIRERMERDDLAEIYANTPDLVRAALQNSEK